MITMIAAVDKNLGIGKDNGLPWVKISEDFQHFKRHTVDKPVVMGRKTFDSIGRALPKRQNIVITRDTDWLRENVTTMTPASMEAVYHYLKQFEEAMIIGGAEIYRELLPYADKLILTEIDATFDCDTFFPTFDRNVWIETSRETKMLPQYPFAFSFVEYKRMK